MDGAGTARIAPKVAGERGRLVTNWSQTYRCVPELYFRPKSDEDVRQVLLAAQAGGRKVRAIGCGFSPNDVFCTTDYMLDMRCLDRILKVDKESHQVTVQAGIVVERLTEQLLEQGLMLITMGALSSLTIGGAVSTATHGSGKEIYNMAGYVVDMDVMDAQGVIRHCSRSENADIFLAALCGLGAVGIILNLTVQCEPACNLRLTSYEAKLDDVLQNLNTHLSASDYFRFYWFPNTDGVVCQHIKHTNEPGTKQSGVISKVGSVLLLYFLEFLLWLGTFASFMQPWTNTLWLKISGRPYVAVDRNDKILNINCYFKQYVNEWAVDRNYTAQVLKTIQAWVERSGASVHCPVEVRFSKGDDIFLSPSSGCDSCYINLVMYRPYGKDVVHAPYWQAFNAAMKEAGGRPHWAKDHGQNESDLKLLYPTTWDRYHRTRRSMDPTGLFLNSYLERVFGRS